MAAGLTYAASLSARQYVVAPDASVRFEVKPREAQVYVDGYYAGIVDDFDGTFQRLRTAPGEHEITIYLEGYRTVRKKVYLQPDNTFKMKAQLEKLAAGEQPEPKPQPVEPPQMAAPPDNQPMYPPAPRNRRGQEPPPPPPSTPAPREPGVPEAAAFGSLTIQVQPRDAEVLIDGEKWTSPAGQERLVIDLPTGHHTIQIQKPGYRTYVTDVEVHRGETTPLNVSLRSQNE